MTDSKRKAPAFQFYADDFLAGTLDMSQSDVGAYIRLLCHQWSRGSIPVDTEKQQRLAGGSFSADVLSKFQKVDESNLANPRLEVERQKQNVYREKQREKGLKSAETRKAVNTGSTAVQPRLQPQHQPEPQPEVNSPSPSPLGTTKEYVPSEVEIEKEETKREANTILETLNEVSGRKYRATDTNLGLIQARLKEPGVDLEGMLKMVRRQAAIWMPDPKMSEYVRPETLFGKKKFDSYYGSRELPIPKNQQQETQTYPKGYEWMADKRDWRHSL